MAQVKCPCGRWCDIADASRYCPTCGQSVTSGAFQALVTLENEAWSEYKQHRDMFRSGFRYELRTAILAGCISAAFMPNQMLWLRIVVGLATGIGMLIWMNRVRIRARNSFRAKYTQLWSAPDQFHSHVPRP